MYIKVLLNFLLTILEKKENYADQIVMDNILTNCIPCILYKTQGVPSSVHPLSRSGYPPWILKRCGLESSG